MTFDDHLSKNFTKEETLNLNWKTQAEFWETKARDALRQIQTLEETKATAVHALAEKLASDPHWKPIKTKIAPTAYAPITAFSRKFE